MNPVALHAFNPGPITGTGNWTWLIPGSVPTLIDAGQGDPRHIESLERALGGVRLAQVLVTHGHTDHAGGAAAIAARMPGVRFRKLPWPERDARWEVHWQAIEDGEVIPVGDTSVTAVHTPGHAPDHLCFWHPESRALFGGDLAVQGATVWIPTGLQGDLTDYLASLRRVLDLQPDRILPSHGPVIADPDTLLRGYLDHRQARERQVIDALRRGDADPDTIVERLYQGVGERLIPLAKETVIAHLIKLEREQRVSRTQDTWHIMEP